VTVTSRDPGPWPLRVAWVLLALLAGPALADSLDGTSAAVRDTASVGLWGGWLAVLVATLVPRASTLTIVRMGAPAALAATVAAAVHGPAGADDAVAIAASVAAVATAWWAVTADAFVDGSSYGDERRFALRSPPSVLVAAVPVAWALAVVVPAVAALLLAARAWVPGVAAALIGAAGIRLGVPAIHRLSRRWLVLVPAGLVVHDHLALADPVLLRRSTVRELGPAPAGPGTDTVVDLTLGAGGLVVEVGLAQELDLPLAVGQGRRRTAAARPAVAFLVAPGRPGAFLRVAGDRLTRRRPADLPGPAAAP
jgi:hypothetical protein